MSRIKHVIKNAKISTFFFLITTFLGFYSRKLFLDYLGDDFIGLTATLKSFLGFLNLAELGVGSALGFSLYQALYQKNHERINELISLVGYLYNKIGKIVLILGVILSIFFPFIFKETTIPLVIIYYLFYAYLISSLLNYFYNYHMLLLQADQKGYISTAYLQTTHIIKIVTQITILYLSSSYILFITIELVSIVIINILFRSRIKKEYPWLNLSSTKNKALIDNNKDIILKIKQIFIHRISNFILKGTDNILIFYFVNLQSVAFIGNYYLIVGSSITLFTNLLSGTGASVGNLVAEDNKINIKRVFWELMSLNHFIGGVLFMSLYYGVDPVIALWLGDKYVMSPNVIFLLLANLYIMRMRVPVDEFINAYGLFHDTWAPITEGLLNLIFSMVLAHYYGIEGVLLGTLISVSSIVLIWKPYFLYKNGFKISVLNYWKGFVVLLLSFLLAFFVSNTIIEANFSINKSSWFSLIVSLFKIGLVILTIYTSFIYILNKGFRVFIFRVVQFIKNKIT